MKLRNKILTTATAVASALALSAPAHAVDVDYFGWVHTFIESDKVTGGSGGDSKPGVKLTNFISVIGVKMTEPLNDVHPGLKYEFKMVSDIYTDNQKDNLDGNRPINRDTRLGNQTLTSSFVTPTWGIGFGHDAHSVWKRLRENAPLRDLEGTMIGEIHQRQKLRFSNAVFTHYKPVKGVKISYDHSFSEKEDVDDPWNVSAEITSFKNLRLTGTYWTNGEALSGFDKTNESTVLTASYQLDDLGLEGTKVWYTWSDDTYYDKESQGNSVYLSQQITPKFNVAAGYGWRDTDDVVAYNGGFNYVLTKNLQIQGRVLYEEADNEINFTTANDLGGQTGKERVNYGLGLKFTF